MELVGRERPTVVLVASIEFLCLVALLITHCAV